MYYNDGKGSSYRVSEYWSDPLTSYTHIVKYNGKDKRFMFDRQHIFSNGEYSSDYYMEYADKKREYFGYNGLLLGIVDRFGNTITFKYETRELFVRDNVSKQTMYLLSSITDSIGREVKISYENNIETTGSFIGNHVYIRVYEGNPGGSESNFNRR